VNALDPGSCARFWSVTSRSCGSDSRVSLVGDDVFSITLALQTLELSSRPTALAAVLAARALPRVLFVIVAGAVSD
jgi:hypothetical protein